jgi:hypothetical protein
MFRFSAGHADAASGDRRDLYFSTVSFGKSSFFSEGSRTVRQSLPCGYMVLRLSPVGEQAAL